GAFATSRPVDAGGLGCAPRSTSGGAARLRKRTTYASSAITARPTTIQTTLGIDPSSFRVGARRDRSPRGPGGTEGCARDYRNPGRAASPALAGALPRPRQEGLGLRRGLLERRRLGRARPGRVGDRRRDVGRRSEAVDFGLRARVDVAAR